MVLLRDVWKRIDFVAAIDSQGTSAEKEKRNVGAEACGDFHQTRQRHLGFGQPHHADERRGGVARPSTQAARDRDSFLQLHGNASAKTDFGADGFDCTPHEIVRTERQCRIIAR